MMIPYNSLSRYKIRDTDRGYCFDTESGNTYFVTFIKYPTLTDFLPTEVYMMNIDRRDNTNHRNGCHNLVRNTILFIIGEFFYKHNDALITICDVVDGRQACRRRLFSKWFRKFGADTLEKIDSICTIEDTTTYTSIMFRKEVLNKEKLKHEFALLGEINFYNSEP